MKSLLAALTALALAVPLRADPTSDAAAALALASVRTPYPPPIKMTCYCDPADPHPPHSMECDCAAGYCLCAGNGQSCQVAASKPKAGVYRVNPDGSLTRLRDATDEEVKGAVWNGWGGKSFAPVSNVTRPAGCAGGSCSPSAASAPPAYYTPANGPGWTAGAPYGCDAGFGPSSGGSCANGACSASVGSRGLFRRGR